MNRRRHFQRSDPTKQLSHLIDLCGAQRIVLACAIRYRLPEPTRLAGQLVGAAKRAMG